MVSVYIVKGMYGGINSDLKQTTNKNDVCTYCIKTRGVTIVFPQAIRIAIFDMYYDTYHDTFYRKL